MIEAVIRNQHTGDISIKISSKEVKDLKSKAVGFWSGEKEAYYIIKLWGKERKNEVLEPENPSECSWRIYLSQRGYKILEREGEYLINYKTRKGEKANLRIRLEEDL